MALLNPHCNCVPARILLWVLRQRYEHAGLAVPGNRQPLRGARAGHIENPLLFLVLPVLVRQDFVRHPGYEHVFPFLALGLVDRREGQSAAVFRRMNGALRVGHQLQTLLQTFCLSRLGYPLMNILPHAFEVFGEEDRRAAEPFFAVLALLGGTHIIRTHELRTVAKIRDVMLAFEGD